jgi:SAM-dependent methyltransferase
MTESAAPGRASCPLCGGSPGERSWLGGTLFEGERFEYVPCRDCGSLFVHPMPSPATLATMYGPCYSVAATGNADEPRSDDEVVATLAGLPTGTFVDHGCGQGDLLRRVAETGWRALGDERDADVARATASATGLDVLDRAGFLDGAGDVDVIHLGDVVEHLTEPLDELDAVLKRLRPGGLLLAQGPLEGNTNLFFWLLERTRRARGRMTAHQPPYHVVLATAMGQRRLFARAGLIERRFDVTEVAWPAPATRRDARAGGVRGIVLYAVRQASMRFSRRRPGWGNRYLYVGAKP